MQQRVWSVLGAAALIVGLGCSGVSTSEEGSTPPPASEPETDAWIEQAVRDALDYETMPGTEPEAVSDERLVALRAFFQAHPEYSDPEKRAQLGLHACGLGGVEAAHEYLASPPPREPLVVSDDRPEWVVFVAHADNHCTSDDWGWYTAEANEFAMEHGVVTGYASPDNDVVVIESRGAEVARVPVTGQGFFIVRAGKAPQPIAYEPGSIQPAIEAYLR